MKVFHLPAGLKALVFDMDLTLYTNPEYGRYQNDILVEKLGKLKGLSFEEMSCEINAARKTWSLSHSGKTSSLSNILCGFGISIEKSVLWRNELIKPELFIKEDPVLKETLEILSNHYFLGIVTNNPVLVARKTLAALGADGYFSVVVGLDTCMTAKPHEIPFLKFSELSGFPCQTCVSIGDRYDVDLDIPLKLGMGGILVDGVEDVYKLPGILLKGGNYGI